MEKVRSKHGSGNKEIIRKMNPFMNFQQIYEEPIEYIILVFLCC